MSSATLMCGGTVCIRISADVFTAQRQRSSDVTATASIDRSSVRPSVCLSHAGIVSKRLNVESRKQRQPKEFRVLAPKICAEIWTGSPLTWAQNLRGEAGGGSPPTWARNSRGKVEIGELRRCMQVLKVSCKRGTARICCCAPCCCGAGRAAIDRYILPAGPTAANPPHDAATGERDRQTDGQRTVS